VQSVLRASHYALQSLVGAILFLSLGPLSVAASTQDRERWDNKYDSEVYLFGTRPTRFLEENIRLLPKGKALDIAMGEGRNGVFLAIHGFDVLGVDISAKGLEKAHKLAEQNHVKIETQVVDLESYTLPKNTFDVVMCTYYMQRNLFPKMKEAVKPGGMVYVETYNVDYVKYTGFRREWALEMNELLDVFKDFKIIKYEIYDDGSEAYSSIIAQRPMP